MDEPKTREEIAAMTPHERLDLSAGSVERLGGVTPKGKSIREQLAAMSPQEKRRLATQWEARMAESDRRFAEGGGIEAVDLIAGSRPKR